MKQIQLKSKKYPGLFVSVDDEDFEKLNKINWFPRKHGHTFYATCNGHKRDKYSVIPMHRYLLEVVDPKIEVDHKNGNGLDNQRSNLRIATRQQNARNSRMRPSNRTGYKGIWEYKPGKFRAAITVNGKTIHLGVFNSPQEASAIYEAKAKEIFGEFYRQRS